MGGQSFLEGELGKVYGHRPTTSAGEPSGLPEIDQPREGLREMEAVV